MAVSDWSTTASNNNAAPPNGAPEGMTPGGINDVLRQIMADVRAFYDNTALKDAAQNTFANGSASAPALSFTADPNTGIYRISDDTLGLTAGGVRVASISQAVIDLEATELRLNGNGIAYTSSSGTYTPTLTNVQNTSSLTARVCQYMRVGNVVTVSGSFSATMTSSGAATTIRMTLPVASNFTQQWQLGGGGGARNTTTQSALIISADTTNDAASIDWVSAVSGALEHFFSFTYQIL